jgi:hypothetical protein
MDNNKIRLVSLLASYHLTSIVGSPTKTKTNSMAFSPQSNTLATAIDYIFFNRNRNKTFSIIPLYNGLSDHNAQFLTLGKTPFLNYPTSFSLVWFSIDPN